MRRCFLLLLLCASLWADDFRLYLKDGSSHVVREYQVQADRVRYYSTERGEWEELPLDLVDLKRTVAERTAKEEAEKKDVAEADREDKFDRALRAEIEAVPPDPGVYIVTGVKVRTFPRGETRLVTNKRRSVLKAITPIPIVAGKSTLELEGERSREEIADARPNFYFRPSRPERFTIVKLRPKKGARIVQAWNIAPVVNEIYIDQDAVDVFRQEVRPGLYKVWPTKPLTAGEYALIEWTENGEGTEVWDFRVAASAR